MRQGRRDICRTLLSLGAGAAIPGRVFAAVAASNARGVDITKITGGTATLGATAIGEFAAGLRGALLAPGESGYESARRVWNGMIDRRPALIARCAGACGRRPCRKLTINPTRP